MSAETIDRLIPIAGEDEVPDLPEGWTLTTIGDACQVNPPKPPKDFLPADAPVTFVPMPAVDAQTGTIATPAIRPFHEVRGGYTAFQESDVIVAKITPCMENGKAAVARGLVNGIGFGSTEFHVLRSDGAVLPEFLHYFVRQSTFRQAAADNMTGSVGQERVPEQFIVEAEIPLPPLAEQRRIVARIESLLDSVARSERRLSAALTLVKQFRRAVLAAACSGRLTEDWRETTDHATEQSGDWNFVTRNQQPEERRTGEELPSLPSSWRWTTFGGVCDDITVGYVGPMVLEYREDGIPFLRSLNVKEFRLDYAGLKYISPEFHAKLKKCSLKPGDIVVVRSGNPGTASVIPDNLAEANCSDLVVARPSERLCPQYGCIVLNSQVTRSHVEQNKVGIAQSHFNVASMRLTPLPLLAVAEQEEIVRRVEALFGLADSIEARVAAASAQVGRLSGAILAKAFRGELVPTEAELARREGRAYEPAALLERIRVERAKGEMQGGRKHVSPARQPTLTGTSVV